MPLGIAGFTYADLRSVPPPRASRPVLSGCRVARWGALAEWNRYQQDPDGEIGARPWARVLWSRTRRKG